MRRAGSRGVSRLDGDSEGSGGSRACCSLGFPYFILSCWLFRTGFVCSMHDSIHSRTSGGLGLAAWRRSAGAQCAPEAKICEPFSHGFRRL